VKIGEYEMCLVAGYFDESTDEDTEGLCYTVAGFIGNQHVTALLDLYWKDVLDRYEIEYFKASELNAGTGQFQKFRDEPLNTNWRPFSQREKDLFTNIKTDFTDVIVKNASGLCGIAIVLILPDLERLRLEYKHAEALPVPYSICANVALVEAGMIINALNTGRSGEKLHWLRPVFDSHEIYSNRTLAAWATFCERNPDATKYMLRPHYEREQDYRMLQAADNLAFEVRKLTSRIHPVKQAILYPVRASFGRLWESKAIFTFYTLDYAALKALADVRVGIYPEALRDKLAQSRTEYPLRILSEIVGTERRRV
jgi:hypothetical protein